eukprot:212401-Pyramimonas_sp.AAC.1
MDPRLTGEYMPPPLTRLVRIAGIYRLPSLDWSEAQVSEIFDAISYSKGACVIRMLEAYVGEDSFRKGKQQRRSTLCRNVLKRNRCQ